MDVRKNKKNIKKITGKDYYYACFNSDYKETWLYSTNLEYILDELTILNGKAFLKNEPASYKVYKYNEIIKLSMNDIRYAPLEILKLIFNE